MQCLPERNALPWRCQLTNSVKPSRPAPSGAGPLHGVSAIMTHPSAPADDADLHPLAERIKAWGRELGFQQLGITDVDLAEDETRLERWLDAGHHGEMGFMAKHGTRRTRPDRKSTRLNSSHVRIS